MFRKTDLRSIKTQWEFEFNLKHFNLTIIIRTY
jgi:hypothetical protein